MGTPIDFYTVSTPDPAEIAFYITVDANQLNPGNVPPVGTPYRRISKSFVNPRVNECGFGDYVYTYMAPSGDSLRLFFGKPKTQTEKNTPFRTIYSTRYYPWPPVLEDLRILKTTAFPQSVWNGATTVTAPRYFPRYRYRPTPSINSIIKIEQFLAPTPYDGQALIHPQPTPTEVSGYYLGMSVSFPKCLHPRIILDDNIPGVSVVEGQGTVDVPRVNSSTKQVFPATNFLDWAPFILEDQVQPTSGLFLRERVTVYPPFRPQSIER